MGMYNLRNIDIDCISNGSPHSGIFLKTIEFLDSINDTTVFDTAKVIYSANTYCHVLQLLKQKFTISDYVDVLEKNLDLLMRNVLHQKVYVNMLSKQKKFKNPKNIYNQTKYHYSEMFNSIDDNDFFEIAPKNFIDLLKINDCRTSYNKNMTALDAGCGSGCYTYALWLMGFGNVCGIDFCRQNISAAKNRIIKKNIDNIHFQVADVKNIPFDDCSFDFVLSNGVLHHVNAEYDFTLAEIYRVLKNGGRSYLYVMEKPGGILLDTIELLRHTLRYVFEKTTLKILKLLGFRGYSIYNILDHIYVPINKRETKYQMEKYLRNTGFSDLKRFNRGLPNYNVELLYKNGNDPENIWKYGVGENIYIFRKL